MPGLATEVPTNGDRDPKSNTDPFQEALAIRYGQKETGYLPKDDDQDQRGCHEDDGQATRPPAPQFRVLLSKQHTHTHTHFCTSLTLCSLTSPDMESYQT